MPSPSTVHVDWLQPGSGYKYPTNYAIDKRRKPQDTPRNERYQMRGIPQRQTVDYFEATPNRTDALEQLGRAVVATTPIAIAARLARAPRGVGADEELPPTPETDPGPGTGGDGFRDLAWVAAGVLVVLGALSYQAGKAMSPNRAQAKWWGLAGIPVGMITGPWGLGIMGIVSNSKKG